MATEYNIAKDHILGDSLFLYLNTGSGETQVWTPLAYSTTCSLSITSDQIDCSSKFDGSFTAALAGKISWSISTDCLMTYIEGSGFDYFYDKMIKREAFLVKFGQAKSVAEQNYEADDTKIYYTGTAYLTNCSIEASNNSVATMTVELTGNGPLEMTKPKA